MARTNLLALLLLAAVCAASAKTCARSEWRRVFGTEHEGDVERLSNDAANLVMTRAIAVIERDATLKARTRTTGCTLVKWTAITGCYDNSPVKASRDNLWFFKYRAAYSCGSGNVFRTIWAYADSDIDGNKVNFKFVRVPQATASGAW